MHEGVLDLAGKLHLVGGEFVRQLGLDAYGHELLRVAFLGVFQFALDVVWTDADLFDVSLGQVSLKLAVGDFFDLLCHLDPQAMQDHDPPQGDKDVPDVELRLLIHNALL